ncbi:SNF1-interacting protein [Xylographa opegraphella]|nr:SNF1-interacting protein [Xylographa opegraphella]
MAEALEAPTLIPVGRPISLIPVGLKEAALDSPSFRATTLHFSEQVDAVEKWLEGSIKSVVKLSHEISQLDSLVHGFLNSISPPAQLSEAIIDHDYTLLAVKQYGEGAKDFWVSTLGGLKKLEGTIVEPSRSFLQNELRGFKDTRRQLDQSQRQLDNLQSRYSAQTKTKEASALREDAFQLHEARKAYLKASMDFSIAAPQLRMSFDKLLVRIFYDQWRDMRTSRENTNPLFLKWNNDLERIKGWSREMESGEKTFRKELQTARKQIEDTAEVSARPSRELEDYSTDLAATVGSKGPSTSTVQPKSKSVMPEKQGWLNLRTLSGKPARALWVRRWFFVKNGIFGWLVQGSRSGGVEESERIGVLLCGVRPAAQEERRFCFEVKTKDTTILLQAESQQELADWMGTFDIAKQKALEDPASTDSPVTTAPRALDPAFAISQPSAPEFAASAADAGMQQSLDDSNLSYDRASTLPAPGSDTTGPIYRGSFDIGSNRRASAMDKESDSSRDQANKIIQKLDLHRRGVVGSTGVPTLAASTSSLASGGIASLISASHMSLPVGPGAMPPLQTSDSQAARQTNLMRNLPPSTLAPSTLANPPNPTNLSTTAVIVNGERGIGMGRADMTGGMPSGIMANLWGSSNWGYINRIERGEVKPTREGGKHVTINPNPFSQGSEASMAINGTTNAEPQRHSSLIDKEKAASIMREPSPGHRKTISLGGDAADLQRTLIVPQPFPNYYPLQLKTQDAQFRLLFPNVKSEEKLVLVFRATWNPNDLQEFPGRVYVTAKDTYFYSNHLGLVLITSISLASILEVTAAPGRDCDFIFLHLKQTTAKVDFTRVTVKTFLEPLKLLQKRLNFLVQNCNSDEPYDLENIMKILIKLEHEDDIKSPSLESWEDGPSTPTESFQRNGPLRTARDLRANVLVDQGLLGHARRSDENKEAKRFKLPGQPVVYVPRGVTHVAVEKELDISPKALFHVMFGDRSAVWQLLYQERQAQRIKQGPWVQEEQQHLRRTFEYSIEYLGMLRQICQADIKDNQMIDVLNDHLCYVATDRKTPWHLPYHQHFTLISKIVITHIAKSKCKLAIYTAVDWSWKPLIVGGMIEAKALSELQLDALDLADVITEQVRKLGAHSRTKKAIQIFGQVGQLKHVTEFGPNDSKVASQARRFSGRRSLTYLTLEAAGSIAEDVVTSAVISTAGVVKWMWRTVNANLIILIILAISVMTNLFFSSQETSEWWKERHAGSLMSRLGVGPDLVMSKAVHLQDLDLAIMVDKNISFSEAGPCFQAFQAVTSLESPSSSSGSTARRLQRTRRHLGTYRHDLMVAMRVVNSIEKEILQAEWEDWIVGETTRCTKMEKIIANENETQVQDMRRTKGRFDEYCASCNEAQTQLLGHNEKLI